jgi:hypothetical protein
MSPLKAIREKCLDCNGSALEVKLCPCKDCSLYPFRFGKNPYIKRTMTPEQKEKAVARLAEARKKKQG